MATILRHTRTNKEYVLVGTGLGMFQSTKPHWFLGNLAKEVDDGVHSCVAVADASGSVHWFDSQDMAVVSVDGQSPAELLAKA